MRLTNYMRDAFVKAVMNDVPQIDYSQIAHKVAQDYLVECMPPKVRAVYDDSQTRHYLTTTHTYFPGTINNASMRGVGDDCYWWKETPDLRDKISEIAQQLGDQTVRLGELESKINAVAYACTTREALAKAPPEFEKYLPAEATKAANLPAVANVVADFVKAEWPKGKKATA